MRIVLDTNVLVSGLLSPYGSTGEIVRMAASGTIELCYDARILCEYRNVLIRPAFSFNKTYVDDLIVQIKACGELVPAEPLSRKLPDPDDKPFLEAALAGRAKCLVTGNLKHYPEKKRNKTVVVSPAEFLNVFYRVK